MALLAAALPQSRKLDVVETTISIAAIQAAVIAWRSATPERKAEALAFLRASARRKEELASRTDTAN